MRLSNSARITQPASEGQDENPVPPKKAELITCYPHTAAKTQARRAKCKFKPICRVTWVPSGLFPLPCSTRDKQGFCPEGPHYHGMP